MSAINSTSTEPITLYLYGKRVSGLKIALYCLAAGVLAMILLIAAVGMLASTVLPALWNSDHGIFGIVIHLLFGTVPSNDCLTT